MFLDNYLPLKKLCVKVNSCAVAEFSSHLIALRKKQ